MKATQTNAINLEIRLASVRWVSSKLNPLDLKTLNMVSICHRSLYFNNASGSGLKVATMTNSILPSRLRTFMPVRYTHCPSGRLPDQQWQFRQSRGQRLLLVVVAERCYLRVVPVPRLRWRGRVPVRLQQDLRFFGPLYQGLSVPRHTLNDREGLILANISEPAIIKVGCKQE